VRLDVSAFRIDWKDAQVNAIAPGPIPLNGIANVGKARINGVEMTAAWSVTGYLKLSANVAWLDAKTSEVFTSNNGAAVPAATRLPGTAKLQSSLQATWDFDGPWDTSSRLSFLSGLSPRGLPTFSAAGRLVGFTTLF